MGIDQMEIDQIGIDQMLNFKTGYPANYKNLCLDFAIQSNLQKKNLHHDLPKI